MDTILFYLTVIPASAAILIMVVGLIALASMTPKPRRKNEAKNQNRL